MDQITHDIRRANWLNIVKQCQQRPAGMTVTKWLSDNGVKEKAYYYWLRKFRLEAYEQMNVPALSGNTDNEISFAEMPYRSSTSGNSSKDPTFVSNATAVISCNGMLIGITNDISDRLLETILKVNSHA